MKEQFLMKDNHWVGWLAITTMSATSQYGIITGNHYEYASGGVANYAMYGFTENNTVIVHPDPNPSPPPHDSSGESHGIFTRSNAYVASNNISGVGTKTYNDGETIAFESVGSEGNFNRGSVVSAAANAMTVTPSAPLVNPVIFEGELNVLITDGRGLGELRKVTAISGNTITVATLFDIIPDSTSKWLLFTPNKNITIYNNTGNDNTQGIVMFGNGYDVVAAKNTLSNTAGIVVWGINGARDFPSYFIRVAGNTITGTSRRGNRSGIGMETGRWSGPNAPYLDVIGYGLEIIGNRLIGNGAFPNHVDITTSDAGPFISGINALCFEYGNRPNEGSGTSDITNTLIEGNTLSNLTTGITLSHLGYGQVVRNNTYDGKVFRFLLDSDTVPYQSKPNLGPYGKSDNTLVVGNMLVTPR